MTTKGYNSPEYFAQQFKAFLRGEGNSSRKTGGVWPAEQHGDSVNFSMKKKKYLIKFEGLEPHLFAHLEELTEGEYIHRRTLRLNPERSKTGRLSGNYFEKVLFKQLLG